MNKKQLTKWLDELPLQIYRTNEILIQNKMKLLELKNKCEQKEVEIKLWIYEQRDEKGSRMYNQENLRNAALVQYINSDVSLTNLYEEIRNSEIKEMEYQNKLDFLNNLQKNYRLMLIQGV